MDRALDMVEALARIGPASLADLAAEAGCTRPAGFRLLRTLQARGFAIQDKPRGNWRLGARWGMLAQAAQKQGALAAAAMPFMAAGGSACGENVYLTMRDGLESETIALYQHEPALRVYSEIGKREPLHAGAGRLLLAYAPVSIQQQVLAQRLPRFTSVTRTEPEWIRASLVRIRAQGWLIARDEMEIGAVSVCAPVRDSSGQVIAGLCITAPSFRMRPPRPQSLLHELLEAVSRLSAALGAREASVEEDSGRRAGAGGR
ncbi:MAG: IclR family transcriptional regulator [Acetobacteraceae bacterium]|nr:IclR family transcriptional regulator [Acetobacteraceae bacterium]